MKFLISIIFLCGLAISTTGRSTSYYSTPTLANAYASKGVVFGTGLTRGAAYSEAFVKVPSSGQVYRRVTYGAKGAWTTALYWKTDR